MTVNRQSNPPEKRTEQYMHGWSFDEELNVLAMLPLSFDGTNLQRGGAEALAFREATDSGDANVSYIGKAPPGTATSAAKWQIKKIDKTTGTIGTLADGDANFDNVWDNRESLSYS